MFDVQHRGPAWSLSLAEGLNGLHVLFEPELVRFTMRREDAPRLTNTDLLRLYSVMEALRGSDDPAEGKAWVAGAPLEVQEILIRAYFESLFDYLETQPLLAN